MAATTETTINDLADAYAATDTTCTRDDHLACLLAAAAELGIPVTPDTVVTDDQYDALDQWLSQI